MNVSENSRTFCCPGLENAVRRAGERGIAIVLEKQGVQSRGVAKADEIRLQELCKTKPELDLWINVSAETGLKYCPWCGTLLQDIIESNEDCFKAIAEKHWQLIRSFDTDRS
jgi:hypothetical protein